MSNSDTFFDRLPPQNLEAELSVLGAMFLDNECIGLVLQQLKPEHFYSGANRRIYETILELYDANQPVDMVILRDALARKKLLEDVGGAPYLVEIAEAVPSAARAEHYAAIIREKYTRRALISAATQILRDAHESSENNAVLIDRVEKRIFEMADGDLPGKSVSLKEVMKEVLKRIEEIQDLEDREHHLTGINTGFEDLNRFTSGFQNGEMIVVAARPSVGKSTFALNIGMRVGVRSQLGVALFSLEMGRNQVALNMLCSLAQIDAHRLRLGMLGEDAWPRFSECAGTLYNAPIFIDDTSVMTVLQLRAKARRLKMQHDIRLIVVDYIQLMDSPVNENRQQQIAEISRGLKALARELNVPVVALSQLNRAVDRENRRPRLSDLRESGAIEQDADVVLLLHRPDYYEEKKEMDVSAEAQADRHMGSVTEIIVAKQRNGPTGMFKLSFFSNELRFEPYAEVSSGLEASDLTQF